jgi:RimJ/RimL family protein N-acetyltransferase
MLRPATTADVSVLATWQTDPQSVYAAAFMTPADAWRDILADPNNLLRCICYEGSVIGYVGTFPHDADREITYWLERSYWGRGLASAAVRMILAEEAHRPVFARVAADNAASIRVLERCGFRLVGESLQYAAARDAEIVERLYQLA